MLRIQCTLLGLFFFLGLFAQGTAEGCDGSRYLGNVFTNVKKTTVQYGTNINQANGMVDLSMDIYEPVGDNVSKRPTVVLAHGGSYILGNKTDLAAVCQELARAGFVAASMSYRLYPFFQLGLPDSAAVLTTAVMSMGDMKAAIRYMREDAATTNTFHVDPDFVFCGGYSAGAITAVHVANMDSTDNIPAFVYNAVAAQGGFEGNTGSASNRTYSSKVSGVVSRSGGMYRADWIDAGDPMICSMHGTSDDVVYYDSGLANGLLYLDGSARLHQRATTVGVRNYLKTVQGGGHTDIYFNAPYAADLADFTKTMLQVVNEVLCNVSDAKDVLTPETVAEIAPNPNAGSFSIQMPASAAQFDLSVVNLQGQVVFSQNNVNPSTSIQSNLPTGMYFVQIKKAGRVEMQKKMMIER